MKGNEIASSSPAERRGDVGTVDVTATALARQIAVTQAAGLAQVQMLDDGPRVIAPFPDPPEDAA